MSSTSTYRLLSSTALLGLCAVMPLTAAAGPKKPAKPAAPAAPAAPAKGAVAKPTKPGKGVCVFSTDELPKGKESDYKLQNAFNGTDDIHMRCYFDKTPKEYAKDGKLGNTLRGPFGDRIADNMGDPGWYATITWSDDHMFYFRTFERYVESDQGDWDQERFDLKHGGSGKDVCDFMQVDTENCVDMQQETINLGKRFDKTGPYTTEVCVDVFYEKADTTQVGDDLKQHMVRTWAPMSHGCFTWTVDIPK